MRKRSRRRKRKIGQEGGAVFEKGIRNLHSSQAWRENDGETAEDQSV